MTDLMEWAHAHGPLPWSGNDLEIPELAAGSYRLCVMGEHGGACREGVLARGGELTLGAE